MMIDHAAAGLFEDRVAVRMLWIGGYGVKAGTMLAKSLHGPCWRLGVRARLVALSAVCSPVESL